MKKNNFLKGLLMLMLAFFATTSALAQNLKLSAEKCFIAPGEIGSVVVCLTNDVDVDIVACKVKLPDGLSFVTTKGDKIKNTKLGRCANIKTLTNRCEITSYDSQECYINLSGLGEESKIVPGSGEIFSFDVKAADDLAMSDNITFRNVEMAPKSLDYDIVEQESFKVYAINNEYKIDFAIDPIKVVVGQPTKVAISLGFDKKPLGGLAFDLVLPEGVKVVNSPEVVEERCPDHVAKLASNGHFVVRAIAEPVDFVGTNGQLCSFEIQVDDKFVDGSEILCKDVYAVTTTYPSIRFHSPDLKVKITKDGTATGINAIESEFAAKADGIYTISGLKVNQLVKGVNIVVKDGKATKVVKK